MRKNQSGCHSENLINVKSNKRQGDWVCCLCNNLNYSFRETCNRCKNVTRDQNDQLAKTQQRQRNPLGQLSLNRHSSFKQEAHYEKDQNCYFSNERTRKYKIIEPVLQQFEIVQEQPVFKISIKQCVGFSSLLFLTPTRYIKLNQEQIEQDISQKDCRSPYVTNSVSPLIRALKDQINYVV